METKIIRDILQSLISLGGCKFEDFLLKKFIQTPEIPGMTAIINLYLAYLHENGMKNLKNIFTALGLLLNN